MNFESKRIRISRGRTENCLFPGISVVSDDLKYGKQMSHDEAEQKDMR